MRRIVLDIETCAYPFESLAESQQEYLLRYAEKETDPGKKQEQTDQAIRYTSLYPLTAKCVAIGIYDIDKNKAFVYYESEEEFDKIQEVMKSYKQTYFPNDDGVGLTIINWMNKKFHSSLL